MLIMRGCPFICHSIDDMYKPVPIRMGLWEGVISVSENVSCH